MKKIILTIIAILIFIVINAQNNNGYIKAISLGIDPNPTFSKDKISGLDANLKLIFGNEYQEYGLAIEYFSNIDYASIGIFKDFIITGKGTSFDTKFQTLIGTEILLISRFNGENLNLKTGFFGISAGANATARWNITEKLGIESIANITYRIDKKKLWNETNLNRLLPLSVRLNIIYIIN